MRPTHPDAPDDRVNRGWVVARGDVRVSEMRNPFMTGRRLLTLGPDNEPRWVRVYLQAIEGRWAAMSVRDDVLPPEPGESKGLAFFGNTPAEAEREAKTYLGLSEPAN